ncbi:hypothetical protein JW823_00205 [bacterium]|nr:hypothetical protein [candidate division CSSED10-310 bacterium]
MVDDLTKVKNTKRRFIRYTSWIVALLFRLLFPLSDPPANLSWSGGYYADEGFWVHDARNEILFGNMSHDEWHNSLVSPTIHYPVKLIFKFAGTGLLAVRIWAAFLSIMTLFLLDRISKRVDPDGWLFFIFAVNSSLVAYQRTAILESAVLPVAALSMWLWLKGREAGPGSPYILLNVMTGICAAWTWQIKTTQIYFLPLVLIATLLTEPNGRRRYLGLMAQFSGMIAVGLTWMRYIWFPNKQILHQYSRFYLSQQGHSISDLVKNIFTQPPGVYFNQMPILFPASILMFSLVLLKQRYRLIPPVITFSFTWLLLSVLSLMPMGYRPMRYYLPALIPIIILGFRFLMDIDWQDFLLKLSTVNRFAIAIIVTLSVSINVPLLLDRFLFEGRITGFSDLRGFSDLGAIVTLLFTLLINYLVFMKKKMPKRYSAALIAASLIFQSVYVGYRLFTRSYDVLESSRYLAQHLPDNSVLAGQWAPQLALETTFKDIPTWKEFVNWKDPFNRFGITHILAWEYPLGNELDLQRRWFPAEMSRAEQIHTFMIKNSPVSLWKIIPFGSSE